MEKTNIDLCFSGGRTSAMMTIECLRKPEYENALVTFQNTGKEDYRTLDFVNQVDEYLGGNRVVWLEYDTAEVDGLDKNWKPIKRKPGYKVVNYETASRKGEPFEKLINSHNHLPNIMQRSCTKYLKILTKKKYCQFELGWETWTDLVGIRYDEPRRYNKAKNIFNGYVEDLFGNVQKPKKNIRIDDVFDVEYPLVKWKVNKRMVLDYWKAMPFDLGAISKPIGELSDFNAADGNCDNCFLKGKKEKIQSALRRPESFEWWIEQENKTGNNFNKNFTFQDVINWAEISKTQSDFFDLLYDEPAMECFCNVD